MFLRKYLTNARLIAVKQPPFERIIELTFQKGDETLNMIIELFSKGNIILCDYNRNILVPMEAQTWKDRVIQPKQKYVYPPSEMNLGELDFDLFKSHIRDSERNQIVKALATTLSLGGVYAEELCMLSSVDKTKAPEQITDDEFRILLKNFNDILERAKEATLKPQIIFDENNEPIDVQPVDLDIYSSNSKKYFDNFSKALDEYYVNYVKEKKIVSKEAEVENEIVKYELLLKQHQDYLAELKQKSAEMKQRADLIYQHMSEINHVFHILQTAREKRYDWPQIIEKIETAKKQGNKEALWIREILPNDGFVVLNFGDGLEINFTHTVVDNANAVYEKAKKFDEKLPGVESAIAETQERINMLKQKKAEVETVVEDEAPKKIVKREKEWYEKFLWFNTASGKLVIAGRDATQNEILIKKYIEPADIIFHTESPGSPFAIIRNGAEATEEDKREVAIFTICHSRAWQAEKITEVYYVKPEQISKHAPSGEYIAHGAFMIYGKKTFVKDIELRLAVGIAFNPLGVISGPVENVRRKAKYYAIITPGGTSKDDIAKEIREHWLNMALEEDIETIKTISLEEVKEHAIQGSKIFGIIPRGNL
jgi:predicted ribosome quality control (RQC) complex YloA/Tae2 family protein